MSEKKVFYFPNELIDKVIEMRRKMRIKMI